MVPLLRTQREFPFERVMSFEVHMLHGGMGRRWVFRGVLSGKDLIARNEKILSSKSYEGVRWLIIDETAVTSLDLSSEQIRTIKQQDDRLERVLPQLVTAAPRRRRKLGFARKYSGSSEWSCPRI
jgi:hypothetical protein